MAELVPFVVKPSKKMTRKRAEQVIMAAFEHLGGLERLVEWAQTSDDNYREFLRIYVKLLPQAQVERPQAPTPQISISIGDSMRLIPGAPVSTQ